MTSEPAAYRAALRLIQERSAYERGHISNPRSGPGGPEMGLLRTRALLDALDAPDRRFPIVHIAGSKGKGSTAAYVASIGYEAGYRTGLTTSPHLHSMRERIAIDGSPVDETTFANLAITCAQAIERVESDRPELGPFTAFELLTAMALLGFAEQACDLAVVEVGLGGTFDATNVIEPAVTIITRLDLEHTQILGHSLAEIAANKAGIIKTSIPAITIEQDSAAMDVIAATANRLNAPLLVYGRDFETDGSWQAFTWAGNGWSIDQLRSGMAGAHQQENAALAIAAWCRLAEAGLSVSDEAIRQGVARTSLPGRFERVQVADRLWILDGAHTPVAAAALASELLDELGAPVLAIVGFLNDKHPEPFLDALAPAVSSLILTEPHNPRALRAETVLATAGTTPAQTALTHSLADALQLARERTTPGMPIVVAGSLTLVAEAREQLGIEMAESFP